MNTPPNQFNPDPPLADLEARLGKLALRDAGEALSARLETELMAAYARRKRSRKLAVRLACAAGLTLAAGYLALLSFEARAPGARELDTHERLVCARYTGSNSEGASYKATYERRVSLAATERCRIVVSVPEERMVVIPDETI